MGRRSGYVSPTFRSNIFSGGPQASARPRTANRTTNTFQSSVFSRKGRRAEPDPTPGTGKNHRRARDFWQNSSYLSPMAKHGIGGGFENSVFSKKLEQFEIGTSA